MKKTPIAASALALALAAGGALVAVAGPLNPPAGPVTPTYKTLGEVEPRTAINAANTPGDATCLFRISQPGSYYLTGNVTGVAGKHAIVIASGNVTLDLGGFTLSGPGGAGGASGIVNSVSLGDVVVRNGRVVFWPGAGADLLNVPGSTGCALEGLTAVGNQARGLRASHSGRISACTAYGNQGPGIVVPSSCTAESCNTASNVGDGFEIAGGSSLRSCTASLNSAGGFVVSGGTASFENCSATNNAGNGFVSDQGAVFAGCVAGENSGSGIVTNSGSIVRHCMARGNALDGINVYGDACLIIENDFLGNGAGPGFPAAGVHLNAGVSRCRIEGNVLSLADIGLWIEGTGNFAAGNTASSNGVNFKIAAGNSFGPIVSAGVSAVAVNGSTSPGTLGSSDPWANFSH